MPQNHRQPPLFDPGMIARPKEGGYIVAFVWEKFHKVGPGFASYPYRSVAWYNPAMKIEGPTPRKYDDRREIRIGFRMGGIGMEVTSQVAAGAVLGWFFDSWRGTAPTGLLTGSIIGIIVGMWSFIRGSLKLNRELERKHPISGHGRPQPPDRENNDKDSWNRTDTNDDHINPN